MKQAGKILAYCLFTLVPRLAFSATLKSNGDVFLRRVG
jgi:hypothetical protein